MTGVSRAGLDITDSAAVQDAVAGHDVVVNAAAWTNVDAAESAEEAATEVNGTGVRHLAGACSASGAKLLHVSTDYVFPGDGCVPYSEDDPVGPLNAYGRSKLAGESAVAEVLPRHGYVIRTAWLYGGKERNFITTMLDLATRRETVEVVDDQHGQPTWNRALAHKLVELGGKAFEGEAPAGIYHGTAAGQTTWYELARSIFEHAGLDPQRIQPISSEAFPQRAKRPAFSVLSHDRWASAGLLPLQHWGTQLTDAFDQLPALRASIPDAVRTDRLTGTPE
ncbi:dTDP-4-dehydrorhamnose reductase [Streptomonospora salina]|uniref:dTDP-4-dehydrorhamnose reductase n=1 Tax=Streptomonospora salina TaxID=104205 RepID=A0A841EAH4_9ACTN|nr:dTDP-4-dehydrorhamnose reductase [Streptomonospora salina]